MMTGVRRIRSFTLRHVDFFSVVVRAVRTDRKTPAPAPAPPDRRRSDDCRTPCDPRLVRIAVDGEFVAVQAQVVNVSEFGLGLHLNKLHPLRDGMEITIEMYPAMITGTIRYCTQKRNAEAYHVGVLISEVTRFPG
jgi:hypothetical protein